MKHKSGKRKSGKRSFKPLEISFSWFKVVFFDGTLIYEKMKKRVRSQ